MGDFLKKTFLLLTIFFLPFFVFAQEVTEEVKKVVPPETVEEATKLLPALIEALLAGKYLVLGALVVMFATVALRQYALPKWNLSAKALPWVVLVIAFLNGVAAHVVGGMDAKEAATMVLVSGGLASQAWSLGGKNISEVLLKLLGKTLVEPPK
jgi:hypothetical protein